MPNKKKLYDALVKEGYNNFENEDAFNAYVESPENRKTLYNALVDEGFDNFEDERAFIASWVMAILTSLAPSVAV